MVNLAGRVAAVTQEHAFLRERAVEKTAAVVVTSDRGLCGGYNANAIRKAVSLGNPDTLSVVAVGRRAQVQLRHRGYGVFDRVVPLGGEPQAAIIWALADRVGRRFEAGEFDRLVLVHARFLGGIRSEVMAEQALPVMRRDSTLEDAIFEPGRQEMLPELMKRYLRTQVLGAVLEASASEHAARVAAMTAATDNAEDMIRQLVLDYNKARQATITKELSEIVAAAEAAG
jgi:F-type H+-transporting ATPase subunit gamma